MRETDAFCQIDKQKFNGSCHLLLQLRPLICRAFFNLQIFSEADLIFKWSWNLEAFVSATCYSEIIAIFVCEAILFRLKHLHTENAVSDPVFLSFWLLSLSVSVQLQASSFTFEYLTTINWLIIFIMSHLVDLLQKKKEEDLFMWPRRLLIRIMYQVYFLHGLVYIGR